MSIKAAHGRRLAGRSSAAPDWRWCPVGDAERLRIFLAGWDEAERCLLSTLRFVPDEHLRAVIDHRAEQLGGAR